jgi:transposase
MARKKRIHHEASFKMKVVLEALKEQKTLAQLSTEFGIHANQISTWKQEVLAAMPSLLGRKKESVSAEYEELITAPLYQQIGQLKVENDFLKKKLQELPKIGRSNKKGN